MIKRTSRSINNSHQEKLSINDTQKNDTQKNDIQKNDIQKNDIQKNDIQKNDTQKSDIQKNDTQKNDTQKSDKKKIIKYGVMDFTTCNPTEPKAKEETTSPGVLFSVEIENRTIDLPKDMTMKILNYLYQISPETFFRMGLVSKLAKEYINIVRKQYIPVLQLEKDMVCIESKLNYVESLDENCNIIIDIIDLECLETLSDLIKKRPEIINRIKKLVINNKFVYQDLLNTIFNHECFKVLNINKLEILTNKLSSLNFNESSYLKKKIKDLRIILQKEVKKVVKYKKVKIVKIESSALKLDVTNSSIETITIKRMPPGSSLNASGLKNLKTVNFNKVLGLRGNVYVKGKLNDWEYCKINLSESSIENINIKKLIRYSKIDIKQTINKIKFNSREVKQNKNNTTVLCFNGRGELE